MFDRSTRQRQTIIPVWPNLALIIDHLSASSSSSGWIVDGSHHLTSHHMADHSLCPMQQPAAIPSSSSSLDRGKKMAHGTSCAAAISSDGEQRDRSSIGRARPVLAALARAARAYDTRRSSRSGRCGTLLFLTRTTTTPRHHPMGLVCCLAALEF